MRRRRAEGGPPARLPRCQPPRPSAGGLSSGFLSVTPALCESTRLHLPPRDLPDRPLDPFSSLSYICGVVSGSPKHCQAAKNSQSCLGSMPSWPQRPPHFLGARLQLQWLLLSSHPTPHLCSDLGAPRALVCQKHASRSRFMCSRGFTQVHTPGTWCLHGWLFSTGNGENRLRPGGWPRCLTACLCPVWPLPCSAQLLQTGRSLLHHQLEQH